MDFSQAWPGLSGVHEADSWTAGRDLSCGNNDCPVLTSMADAVSTELAGHPAEMSCLAQVQIPPASCVTLGTLLSIAGPQCPPRQSGRDHDCPQHCQLRDRSSDAEAT